CTSADNASSEFHRITRRLLRGEPPVKWLSREKVLMADDINALLVAAVRGNGLKIPTAKTKKSMQITASIGDKAVEWGVLRDWGCQNPLDHVINPLGVNFGRPMSGGNTERSARRNPSSR
ncbi:MAG: hypothetical protein ACKVT0_17855, partial [Planctomycetaceae bacterium]